MTTTSRIRRAIALVAFVVLLFAGVVFLMGGTGDEPDVPEAADEASDDESADEHAVDKDELLARCTSLCKKEKQCEDYDPSGPDCEKRCQADVKEGVCLAEWEPLLTCYEANVCGD